MTNYLYIPLGGNRKGEIKTLRNLFIVFLASGIWHGAGWNFIIWGMLHGICIVINRIWKNTGRKLNKLVGWFITINLVNIFWVFFRAQTVTDAMKVIKGMVDVNNLYYILTHIKLIGEIAKYYRDILAKITYFGNKIDFIIFIFAGISVFFFSNSLNKLRNMKFTLFEAVEINIYFWFGVAFLTRVSQFLYFNF